MFEWDEPKNDETRRLRGFDFSFAVQIFEGEFFELDDVRRDYGEKRIIATRWAEDRLVTVVYTWRGDVRRIISARYASRKERNAYRAIYG